MRYADPIGEAGEKRRGTNIESAAAADAIFCEAYVKR